METDSLPFKFTGKMARLLGRESVSSDTAALFELVKNAYDADATELTITFENLLKDNGSNSRIVLKDNGEGTKSSSLWILPNCIGLGMNGVINVEIK